MKVKTNLKYPISTAAPENIEFWERHSKAYKASGLTRSDYCRQQKVDYDRLGYWLRKLDRKEALVSPSLVAVKVKPNVRPPSPTLVSAPLGTLILKNQSQLTIHSNEALLLILDRYS